jgi:predicted O-methyltransferase YrrM
MTLAEKLYLYTTALTLPRGSVYAEIGSYLGASACFLAAAAAERNSKVYCIDTWQNDAMTEGKRDTWAEFDRNVRAYRAHVHPVRATSVRAARLVPDMLDLLFVDGDHSVEGVRADLEAWLPKLRDNAWLILHDYGWAEGVKLAVADVVRPLEVGPSVILPNLYAAQIGLGRRQGKARVPSSSAVSNGTAITQIDPGKV